MQSDNGAERRARDDGTATVPPTVGAPRLSLHGRIDACRGILAFLVVMAHAVDMCRVLQPRAFATLPEPLDRLLRCTVETGIYWVMGFFVISGYCIHLSVDRLLRRDRFPLRVYVVARLTRILPLYYVGLLFAVVAERLVSGYRPAYLPNGVNDYSLILQLFVVQNLTQTYGSFAASWSITNELCYYLIYGLLACAVAGRRQWPAWIGMAATLVIAAVMQSLYVTVAHTRYVLSAGMLFGLGINWFLGALVAVHADSLARSRVARVVSLAWLPLLGATMYGSYLGVLPNQGIFLISGLAFTLMLVRFQNTSGRPAPASQPGRAETAAKWIGLSSYPTYLFHGPVFILLGAAIARWEIVLPCGLIWVLFTGLGIGSGIALGFLAERPIMDWRGRLLQRLKSANAGAPPATLSRALNVHP
jgi:peptidoglycan/LPS O-acetylase OafA/YrhL